MTSNPRPGRSPPQTSTYDLQQPGSRYSSRYSTSPQQSTHDLQRSPPHKARYDDYFPDNEGVLGEDPGRSPGSRGDVSMLSLSMGSYGSTYSTTVTATKTTTTTVTTKTITLETLETSDSDSDSDDEEEAWEEIPFPEPAATELSALIEAHSRQREDALANFKKALVSLSADFEKRAQKAKGSEYWEYTAADLFGWYNVHKADAEKLQKLRRRREELEARNVSENNILAELKVYEQVIDWSTVTMRERVEEEANVVRERLMRMGMRARQREAARWLLEQQAWEFAWLRTAKMRDDMMKRIDVGKRTEAALREVRANQEQAAQILFARHEIKLESLELDRGEMLEADFEAQRQTYNAEYEKSRAEMVAEQASMIATVTETTRQRVAREVEITILETRGEEPPFPDMYGLDVDAFLAPLAYDVVDMSDESDDGQEYRILAAVPRENRDHDNDSEDSYTSMRLDASRMDVSRLDVSRGDVTRGETPRSGARQRSGTPGAMRSPSVGSLDYSV